MRLEFEPNVASLPMAENDTVLESAYSNGIDFETLLSQGIKAAQSGDRERARLSLSRATQIEPRSEDAWMWLASISDYPEELLAFLGHALEINPENSKALAWQSATKSLLAKTLVQRAIAANEDGSTDLADQCLAEALSLDNDCEIAWFWKASLSSDKTQKWECLQRVLGINPDNNEARAALDALRASNYDADFDRACSAIVAGKRKKAVEILDNIIEYSPDKIEPWILKSHFLLGIDEKVECLEKALVIDPNSSEAKSTYEFLTNNVLPKVDGTSQIEERLDISADVSTPHLEVVATPVDVFNSIPLEVSSDSIEPFSPPYDEKFTRAVTKDFGVTHQFGFDAEVSTNPADFTAPELDPAPLYHEEFPPVTANEIDDHEQAVDLDTIEASSESHTYDACSSDEIVNLEEMEWPHSVDEAPLTGEIVETGGYEDEFMGSIPAPADLVSGWHHYDIGVACPFCSERNDSQAFECGSCRAMLTLSDMETLLANPHADHEIIQQAVTQMEAEWNFRDFNEDELTALGIGHLNLRNYEAGHKYLQEALRLSPNNVMLSSHVNSIAIRLDEINRAPESSYTMPQGKNILVVDDSPTVRKLISAKLEKSGHNVICAEDGVEALARIAERVPDLILLDITMPRMDGYEVCKHIRSNPAAHDLPVVMISGKDGFFDKVRGRMAGTTGYVTKPFGPETLMKALETYLVADEPSVS